MNTGRLFIDLTSFENHKAHGFQEYIFNLLDYFYIVDELNFSSIIIVCRETEKESFGKYRNKFLIKCLNISSYFDRLKMQFFLPLIIKAKKDDVIFYPANTSGMFKVCKELLVIHDLLYLQSHLKIDFIWKCQRKLFVPISIRKTDHIIAISDFTKTEIEKFYPQSRGKVSVVYNYMNFQKFKTSEQTVIEDDYFIAISSNNYHKNQETIFEAFKKYKESGGSLKLYIVGYLNPRTIGAKAYNALPESVKSEIVLKSNITNEELGNLYRNAKCFISASKYEGFGMPVVEAMSFGLPVLLSDIPPHREVSLGKGEYFPPTDSDELAKKMMLMSFDNRGYARDIQTKYAEDNTSAKYVKLLNSL